MIGVIFISICTSMVKPLTKHDVYEVLIIDALLIVAIKLSIVATSDVNEMWGDYHPHLYGFGIDDVRIHYNKIMQAPRDWNY